MNKIKVLQIVNALDGGGVERLLKTYYENKSNEISFDFISHTSEDGILESFFLSRGSNIYKLDKKRFFNYVRSIWRLFFENYDYIHFHQNHKSWLVLILAKLHRSKSTLIVHNHTNLLNPWRGFFSKFVCNILSDKKVACSYEAGKCLFYGSFTTVYNSINFEKFTFDIQARNFHRKNNNIEENQIVIGLIARFEHQKNHNFFVELAKEIVRKHKTRFKFLLIGDGELKTSIIAKVKSAGLGDQFVFMEPIDNVEVLYNAFDCFVLPSLYEGLGIVAIEAQYNGLRCFLSENVPSEVRINENVFFLKLDKSEWLNKFDDLLCDHSREDTDIKDFNKEFSLKKFVENLDNLYE